MYCWMLQDLGKLPLLIPKWAVLRYLLWSWYLFGSATWCIEKCFICWSVSVNTKSRVKSIHSDIVGGSSSVLENTASKCVLARNCDVYTVISSLLQLSSLPFFHYFNSILFSWLVNVIWQHRRQTWLSKLANLCEVTGLLSVICLMI